jgi:hypothetical protein
MSKYPEQSQDEANDHHEEKPKEKIKIKIIPDLMISMMMYMFLPGCSRLPSGAGARHANDSKQLPVCFRLSSNRSVIKRQKGQSHL